MNLNFSIMLVLVVVEVLMFFISLNLILLQYIILFNFKLTKFLCFQAFTFYTIVINLTVKMILNRLKHTVNFTRRYF